MSGHIIMVIWDIKTFLYSSVYPCQNFLNYSAFIRSLTKRPSVLYRAHLCMKSSLDIFNFLEEISSFIFYWLVSSIALHYSLKNAFLSLLVIFWNSAFSLVYFSLSSLFFTFLLFSAISKTFSNNPFTFLPIFSFGMVLITTSYNNVTKKSVHVLQAFCLPGLIPWLYSSPPLYNHKGFDLGHTWKAYWFSLLQFKSKIHNKELMIWATVSSRSCVCWLYRASPSLTANNIINLILVLTIWWWPCVERFVLFKEGVSYISSVFSCVLKRYF